MEKQVEAHAIGVTAQALLADNNRAGLSGVISRGAFVSYPSGWTIFLSYEPFRGPLTINLPLTSNELAILEAGMEVEVAPSMLIIPAASLSISINQARVWQAPPRKDRSISSQEWRFARAQLALQAVLEQETDSDLQELATVFLTQEAVPPIYTKRVAQVWNQLSYIIQDRNIKDIEVLAEVLLGLGTGLTPWGDDILMGMLLMLNRWGDGLIGKDNKVQINQAVVQRAWVCTSGLSAGLLECAASGLADERLIAVSDSIFSGDPQFDRSLTAAFGWGSSSGTAVVFGMAIMVRLFGTSSA